MRAKVRNWFFCVLLANTIVAHAQTTYLAIDEFGKTHLSRSDSVEGVFRSMMHELIDEWRSSGHLLAGIDQVDAKADTVSFKLYQGRPYQMAYASWESLPANLRLASGMKSNLQRPYSAKRIERDIDRLLQDRREHGFPFAQVYVDSIGFEDSVVRLSLGYSSGPLIKFDTLRMTGLKRTDPKFLSRSLGIMPGQVYSYSAVRSIERNIDQLAFLSLQSEPKVAFVNNLAIIELDLIEERVNQFDAILGLLQNDGAELTLTGTADIQLLNLFGRAKELRLNWQRQKEQSQTLDLSYYEPTLAGSRLGAEVGYHQLKEDTTFVNRQFDLRFSMPFGKMISRLTYTRKSGRILGTLRADMPPEIADFDVDQYGLQLIINQLSLEYGDSGWSLESGLSIGDRKILRNPVYPGKFYDSLNLSSIQYQWFLQFQYEVSIGKRISLFHRLSAKSIINDQLFLNDLYRLGGLKTLRGYNELSIFANNYGLSNLEVRWFFNPKSYFFGFYDQARTTSYLNREKITEPPMGIGLGLSLTTENGIFSLVYALGDSNNQLFTLSEAKIHFGFTSTF